MRTLSVLFAIHASLYALHSHAQGMPYILNFNADDYNAHNRNFDIDMGQDGTIYVANFEGLLYYDNAEWRIIHTPDITRITVVFNDSHGIVWVGGYNYFGRLEKKPNGELALRRVAGRKLFRGEVLEIKEEKGVIFFWVNEGKRFKVDGSHVILDGKLSETPLRAGLSDIVNTDALNNKESAVVMEDTTQVEMLDDGLKAIVRKGRGVTVADASGRELYTLTEANGLCSNNVSYVVYNGHGILWGATDDGIFAVAIPSVFSRFTPYEGLSDEVLSIEQFNGTVYVGTNNGLLRLTGRHLERVTGINHACWKLSATPQGLFAATASGIYRIHDNGVVKQLTTSNTTVLLMDGNKIYSGEIDGVFVMGTDGSNHRLVNKLKKVTKMEKDGDGTLWMQNLYGEVWCKQASDSTFKAYSIGVVEERIATIVPLGDKIEVVNADATKPFPYPQFSCADNNGVTWLTNNDGKALYRWKDGSKLSDMDAMLFPFTNLSVRAMLCRNNEVWLGSDNELVVIETDKKDEALTMKPQLLFRSVVLNGDSILWGGYGETPKELPELDADDRNLRFTYALDYEPLVGNTLYRYRLNGGNWSVWADDHDAEFINLTSGSYTIDIQARLANGEQSEVMTMDFNIAYPFYMRWYMNVLYAILFACLVYGLVRLRLHRLNMEKQKLERIVRERTAEVVKQKDEIEEKSKSLEQALDDLGKAQHELIRQEKMATVGKLTQGLIDRILNPLNYINNFSKLSEGLVKDVEANIEDDKDNMDEENYEDTMDVLGMLRGNLQKVGEHGQNTTRTLKAMEEMLKDRSGGIEPMNLTSVLRQDEAMLQKYYAEDISQYAIKVGFDIPDTELSINGNADLLSKMMMSLLGNSVYAVVKKAQREKYQPEISVSVTTAETSQSSSASHLSVIIRDNGIGIESTIIDKIFDPFFTTKTTGEAAGVGLYLSREIVQNHGGDIHVKSVKNEYSEFTITLPTLNA